MPYANLKTPETRAKHRVSTKRWQNTERGIRFQKNARFKREYGITLEQFEVMLHLQGNLCLLCKRPFEIDKDIPVLDHCHTTKKVRGVIHRKCNSAIGLLEDDPILCRLAAEYLERV